MTGKYYAYSPIGTSIIGTLEKVLARCEIADASWSTSPDGTLDFDFQGHTEIFWDGMETEMKDGQRIFLDDNGDEWLEDQLVLRDE